MVEFANPERLWWLLLAPVLGLLYVVLLAWRNSRSGGDLKHVLDRQRGWVKHVVVLLSVLSLMSLLTAWARPQAEVKVPVDAPPPVPVAQKHGASALLARMWRSVRGRTGMHA